MIWTDLEPVASLLAGIGAIAALGLSLATDRHPLRLVERLTAVAPEIRDENTRKLVEDYRDERVASLILLRRAPAFRGFQWWTWALWLLGTVCLAFWLLTAIARSELVIGWLFYFAAVLAFLVGRLLFEARKSRREKWISQELVWRNMGSLARAQPVIRRRSAGAGSH